jgi:putative transport protein
MYRIDAHRFRWTPRYSGARNPTAALGMIQQSARSKVPALGDGLAYAVGNTLLTQFGMRIALLMSRAGT